MYSSVILYVYASRRSSFSRAISSQFRERSGYDRFAVTFKDFFLEKEVI